MKQYNKPRQS